MESSAVGRWRALERSVGVRGWLSKLSVSLRVWGWVGVGVRGSLEGGDAPLGVQGSLERRASLEDVLRAAPARP